MFPRTPGWQIGPGGQLHNYAQSIVATAQQAQAQIDAAEAQKAARLRAEAEAKRAQEQRAAEKKNKSEAYLKKVNEAIANIADPSACIKALDQAFEMIKQAESQTTNNRPEFVSKAHLNKQNIPLLAAKSGKVNIIEYCTKHQLNCGLVDAEGNTPLHIAAIQGNAEVITALLKNGQKMDIKNKAGKSSVDLLREGEHLALFKEYNTQSQNKPSVN